MLNRHLDPFGYKIPEIFYGEDDSPLNLVSSCPCEFWYDGQDASTFTLNGVNVAQWDDKSGNDRHVANAVDATRPSYNAVTGRVDFVSANSDYLRSAAFDVPLAQPNTIFILYKITGDITGVGSAFDGDVALSQSIYYAGDDWRISAGVNLLIPNATDANDNIHTTEFNGATSNYWVNGILGNSGNTGAGALNVITLGARGDITTFGTVEIMEVFGYNCQITATERNALTNYLNAKWSVY